jgi:hypothetical protein
MKNIILIISLIYTNLSFAILAYPGDIELYQGENSFIANLKGDEYFSWIENKKGEVIIYNKDSDLYEYAELKEIDGKLEMISSGNLLNLEEQSSGAVDKAPKLDNNSFDKDKLYEIWQRKRKENNLVLD